MEYSTSPTADATAPVTPVPSTQPTPVEDLEKRLAVLKASGVREYQDGPMHILFERPQQRSEEDVIAKLYRQAQADAERLANGG